MKQVLLISLVVACGSSTPAPVVPPATPPEAPAPVAMRPPEPPPPPPPAVGHPDQSLIPRSVLFGNPERTRVEISPDGKQLAWLAPKDGVLNVWVAPIGKLDQAKPVTSDTKRPIRGYSWAYTNKHILYQQDNAGDENFHVFRVDLADGKTTDLTPYPKARASIDGLSDTAPTTISVGINDRDPKVFDEYTIDLTTGARTLTALNDQEFGGFVLDTQLHPRFATKSMPDGGAEIYVTDVVKKPPADGKLTWKLFDKVPFEDFAGTNVLGVAPGGKAVYMTDSRASDTGAVVSVDIATKKQTSIATDPKAEAGDTIFDPHTGKLQAVAFDYTAHALAGARQVDRRRHRRHR